MANIFQAIKNCDIVALKKCIQEGTDINMKDDNGNTALHKICEKEYIIFGSSKLMIRRKVNPDIQYKHGNPQLIRDPLSMEEYTNCLHLLIDTKGIKLAEQNKDGRNPLHIACINRNSEALHLLLSKEKKYINATDNKGSTPLHLACSKYVIKCIEILLDPQYAPWINVNARDNNGCTPFHIACSKVYTAVIKLLLNTNKIDLQVKNKRQQTPLHMLCMDQTLSKFDCLKLLLEKGGAVQHVNEKDTNGNTPYIMLCEYGCKESMDLIHKLHCLDINITNCSGQNGLYRACYGYRFDIVKQILETNRINDINAVDCAGRTVLYFACEIASCKCLEVLLDNDSIDINRQNTKYPCHTALHIACFNYRPNCIKLLLAKNNIDLDIKNSDGQTALDIAYAHNYSKGIELLSGENTNKKRNLNNDVN